MPFHSRRDLLKSAAGILAAPLTATPQSARPAVSIVRIPNGNVAYAVERAIDLLGGLRAVARGKNRILLKPNLVCPQPNATTNRDVVRTLARLMAAAGNEVSIGEGSACAEPFNIRGGEVFRTSKPDLLNAMQNHIFDRLGYTELAKSLRVPLVNLHTGDLAEVKLPGAFVFEKLTLHRALIETDLLCSVPAMKTHQFAGVTLGMKNLVGAYPGAVYQAVRGRMHEAAGKVEPSGTAAAVVDMVRANRLGLVVIDGSTAMEGNGPTDGAPVPMNAIVAGTNPLATDIVGAYLMGFDASEISTFTFANRAGMSPGRLKEIELRGDPPETIRKKFARPQIVPWATARLGWATREL
jgi:uncharacterized protein (DUF362 family)